MSRSGLVTGVGIGGILGETESDDGVVSWQARGFLRYGLTDNLQGEFGLGIGELRGREYVTHLNPIDYRFVLSPFTLEDCNPFLYAGVGALYFKVQQPPPSVQPGWKEDGWTAFIPMGLGIQFTVNDRLLFESSGGYNYTFSEDLNGLKGDKKDAYWGFLFGLTASGYSGNLDADNDGLSNDEEKQLGTDPHNPDTDGDGLSDGDEIHRYHSNPLQVDSDGDGLKDGEEVTKYMTDPSKPDTDGDGLKDGEEVMTYHTDPLKADTDGDGLNDGSEVTPLKTDPLKADTDGDGLTDGEEVNRYRSNPLIVDTDGGTVSDGQEVTNHTDPLNPNDDLKKEELKVEVGKSIVLEGIVFETGKAAITTESEKNLELAYNTLSQNPEIEVEIRGYTDDVGKRSMNMKLSQQRANAVKAWLVNKGITASRMTAKGFGPDSPVASNATADGKQKNRRIEFFRSK